MRDPYEVLGVERSATEQQITSAYRKLAKKHHPDVNPGKKDAEEKFKEIAQAYDLLSDKEKRAKFDRGEIDASGQETAQAQERYGARNFYHRYGDDAGRTKYRADFGEGEVDLDDLDLESIFGSAFRGGRARGFGTRDFRGSDFAETEFKVPGANMRYALNVDFIDAAKGAVKRLTLPDGKTLDVTIPPGLKDGQVLRLKGKGQPGFNGGPTGDALIEVNVNPHPRFRREGDDVVIEVPITLKEAILGAKIEVPTLDGTVALTVPANSTTGKRLRLRGRGIKGGHQQVELKVILPSEPEPELAAFLETWSPRHNRNPRDEVKS
jgi:DnaJ-class molecular chaperone